MHCFANQTGHRSGLHTSCLVLGNLFCVRVQFTIPQSKHGLGDFPYFIDTRQFCIGLILSHLGACFVQAPRQGLLLIRHSRNPHLYFVRFPSRLLSGYLVKNKQQVQTHPSKQLGYFGIFLKWVNNLGLNKAIH